MHKYTEKSKDVPVKKVKIVITMGGVVERVVSRIAMTVASGGWRCSTS